MYNENVYLFHYIYTSFASPFTSLIPNNPNIHIYSQATSPFTMNIYFSELDTYRKKNLKQKVETIYHFNLS